jgi:hypothetical protein
MGRGGMVPPFFTSALVTGELSASSSGNGTYWVGWTSGVFSIFDVVEGRNTYLIPTKNLTEILRSPNL